MLQRLMKGMLLDYQQNWKLDNMPITLCYRNIENQEFCSRRFPIGCYVTKSGQSKESCNIRDGKNDTFYIFNHLDFEITYHSGEGEIIITTILFCLVYFLKVKNGEWHLGKMVVEFFQLKYKLTGLFS
jgi:hypothetical protein